LEETGKINNEQLRAVFEYLVDEFPTCSIGHDMLIYKKLRSSICILEKEDVTFLSRGNFSKITTPTRSH
jgi:hypothetical protein